MKTKERLHISHSNLKKERGWTDLMIELFFPAGPHKLADNPHYKSAPQMKLYLITEIDKVESTHEFDMVKQRAATRKQSAASAVTTKRIRIINYVKALTIEVPTMDTQVLTEKACTAYNDFKSWKAYEHDRESDFEPASPDSDTEFLNRITTNYLRHRCTSYETELRRIFGKVANDEAYEILKSRINKAIFKQYPHLQS